MTPKLQFPEFTDVWEVKSFGDIFERVTRKNKENNQNILTISAQDGLVSQSKFFSKVVASKDVTGYYLLHKNDYAYNKSYSKGYPMGAIKRLILEEKGVVSTLYICFRSKNRSESFFDQFFEAGKLNHEIEMIAQEGARNHGLLNVSVGDFFETQLTIPKKPEQEKIAGFLTAVDDRIVVIDKKVELLKQYKKGVMQKIFTQQIRFKDKNENDYPSWQEKKLGGFATVKTGNLNVQDAQSDGRYTFFDRSEEIKKYDEYSYNNEALIYAGEGSEFLPRYFIGKYGLHQRAYTIFDTKGVDMKFLYYFMLTQNNHFLRMAVGSTVKSLRMDCFTKCVVPIPSQEEQQKIADFLTAIDEKIKAEVAKLAASKKFKKSLLQRMFV